MSTGYLVCFSTKGCQIGKSLTVACNFSKSLHKDLCLILQFVQKPLERAYYSFQRLYNYIFYFARGNRPYPFV